MSTPLTVEGFIDAFRLRTGWKCEPGTRITDALTKFATKRIGSRRDIDELHIIFCLAHGIAPYKPKDGGTE